MGYCDPSLRLAHRVGKRWSFFWEIGGKSGHLPSILEAVLQVVPALANDAELGLDDALVGGNKREAMHPGRGDDGAVHGVSQGRTDSRHLYPFFDAEGDDFDQRCSSHAPNFNIWSSGHFIPRPPLQPEVDNPQRRHGRDRQKHAPDARQMLPRQDAH